MLAPLNAASHPNTTESQYPPPVLEYWRNGFRKSSATSGVTSIGYSKDHEPMKYKAQEMIEGLIPKYLPIKLSLTELVYESLVGAEKKARIEGNTEKQGAMGDICLLPFAICLTNEASSRNCRW
jgi:hypothetical protein